MHATSLENMQKCYDKYAASLPGERVVLDVGGANVNGTYRSIFSDPRFRYVSIDMAPGRGVDVVMENPYQLPMEDCSQDIVVSGQTLEHCEFFWLLFAEMVRVLKPDGFLFLIVPSAGKVHRYPVDCYRFLPDFLAAMARYTGCNLVESWRNTHGMWRDLVGVFQKPG